MGALFKQFCVAQLKIVLPKSRTLSQTANRNTAGFQLVSRKVMFNACENNIMNRNERRTFGEHFEDYTRAGLSAKCRTSSELSILILSNIIIILK